METGGIKRKRGMEAEAGNEHEETVALLALDDRKNNLTQSINSQPDPGPVMPRLCNRCLSMFSTLDGLQALVSTRGYQHYDKGSLEDSADRGCPLCILFLGSIKRSSEFLGQLYFKAVLDEEDSDQADWEDQEDWGDGKDWGDGEDDDNANLGEKFSSMAYPDHILKMFSVTTRLEFENCSEEKTFTFYRLTDDNVAKSLRRCRVYNRDSEINSIMLRAIRILNECQSQENQHQHCPDPKIPLLPTRVIEVGDQKKSVKLHISKPKERANYVALSYCWGGAQDYVATRRKLSSMTKSLPIFTLPKTIQDAVKVTQKLGIQYLWVDALCIIQDSRTDKIKEINSMGQVYKNATLTIAAVFPDCAYKGFLNLEVDVIRLPFYLPNGSFTETTLMETYLDKSKYSRGYAPPLRTRAWALQEFLLSPRALSFEQAETFWHCPSVDDKPLLWDYSHFKSISSRLPRDIFNCPSYSINKDRSQSDIWGMIMVDYSSRQLALPEDRLPAIAGIAGELQRVWKDDYLAGMWRSCLVKQLCWHVDFTDSNDIRRRRFPMYVAPSWSWLSVDCSVWSSKMTKPEAMLIDCTVSPVDPYSTRGRLKGGILTLHAKLLHATEKSVAMVETLDYSIDKVQLEKSFYLRLGEVHEGRIEGLILMNIRDSTFQRLGHFQHHGRNSHIWDFVKPKIVTII